MMTHMNNLDQFTTNWWLGVISNDANLRKWLQKLQKTEIGGYYDHYNFMAQYPDMDERTKTILVNIADDEAKHSNMIVGVLSKRGWFTDMHAPQSTYWDDILSHVTSIEDYCAANYYGEALAAYRFQKILDCEKTPKDIRSLIEKVLPDEVFHRETLQRLAGPESLSKFGAINDAATKKLLDKKAAVRVYYEP